MGKNDIHKDGMNKDGITKNKGRIVRVDKESCMVSLAGLADISEVPKDILIETDAVRWKGNVAPAVGDFVILNPPPEQDSLSEEGFSLSEILPRKTALYRKDPGGFAQDQVIAANMDIVGLVHGMDQKLSLAKLERGLVLAAESGAESLIIFAKADLAEEEKIQECVQKVQPLVGKPILVTSKMTDAGTGEKRGVIQLNNILKDGKTLVLLGSSGAGKSTLVNSLIFEATQKTVEVRAADSRGRHTTVVRSLIPLPGGGFIIDTPGLRAIGLGDMEVGIEEVFPEIVELAADCKFRDCAHIDEPECAVKHAVEAGTLSAERLERFLKLKEEVSQSIQNLEEAQRKKRH